MPSKPVARVNVEHRLGTLTLRTAIEVHAPWTVLFGPSGSGKSTLLRILAGLTRPHQGRVEILGTTVADTARARWVPPHLRPIRWAGQREALFPQRSVRWNIACGLPDREAHMIDEALEVFELNSVANVLPGQLSGGQRQRVAVVRAAVGARNKLLLLDEPFTGLDSIARDRLIAALRYWLRESPVISVTHEVSEALLLEAHVVRLCEGSIIAQGPAYDVLREQVEHLRRTLGGVSSASLPVPDRNP